MATQFTVSAQEALQQAQAEAMRRENQELQQHQTHLLSKITTIQLIQSKLSFSIKVYLY